MAQVSRRKLNPKVAERIYNFFLEILAEASSPQTVSLLLDDLLSPTEKTMLTKRLAIAVMLEKGYTYQEITEVLKVTPATINKTSLWLKHKGAAFRKAAQRGLKRKEAGRRYSSFDNIFNQIFAYKMRGRKPKIFENPYPF